MKSDNLLCLICCLLCACTTAPPCPTEPAIIQYIMPMQAPADLPAAPATAQPLAPTPIDELLAYHLSLRELNASDLAKELASLNTQQKQARLALQKSMALSLTHNGADLARALVLADYVAKSADPEAVPLKPLAQLLAAQYQEMRRLSDQAEKSAQQAKDSQRRIEQLNDTLEALKAIERTLPARPAPVSGAPQAK